jgi:hypothetical protein
MSITTMDIIIKHTRNSTPDIRYYNGIRYTQGNTSTQVYLIEERSNYVNMYIETLSTKLVTPQHYSTKRDIADKPKRCTRKPNEDGRKELLHDNEDEKKNILQTTYRRGKKNINLENG